MTSRDHQWWDCQPAMAELDDGGQLRPLAIIALQGWWDTVPPQERRNFHRYCCLGDQSADVQDTMHRLRDQIAEVLTGQGTNRDH